MRAPIRREGEWPFPSYSHHLGHGARSLAARALESLVVKFRTVTELMEANPDDAEAQDLIQQARRVVQMEPSLVWRSRVANRSSAHAQFWRRGAKMRCLVLAFETFADLPSNWQSYETVDAYGSNCVSAADAAKFRGDCATAITVHNRRFSIMAPEAPVVVYDDCFVRHPDPWGEPRNWLRAIAMLGESLRGDMSCIHYHQHEGLAFNFLLTGLLDKENVRLERTEEREPGKFQCTWRINSAGLQTGMQTRYRNRCGKIMRRFYTEMGPFFRDVPYFL